MSSRSFGLKAWPFLVIAIVQAFLLLAHWFLYRTVIAFWFPLSPQATMALRMGFFLLGLSFIVAALLGFRYTNPVVSTFYRAAAIWLGLLNFFFWAACLCWVVDLASRLMGLSLNRPLLGCLLFGLALLAGVYGLFNAYMIRIRRISVRLPGLPPSWRGRTALLLSDLHLGNVNGFRFGRRIAAMAARLNPDIIFIAGDLFDGTRGDPDRLAEPLKSLSAPFGVYFASGNHDEFGGVAHYTAAMTRAGIRVLENEMVTVDGLHVVGASYGDSAYPMRFQAFLESLHLTDGQASILLNHVPSRLAIAERAGISLQLSGHTHGGQMFPFTWITRRAFGKFTYGLQQFGKLQVYTSTGAGTWGPPMRVGAHPEVVLIGFE
jgi:predicted MPP superfamily phosphohydrolase